MLSNLPIITSNKVDKYSAFSKKKADERFKCNNLQSFRLNYWLSSNTQIVRILCVTHKISHTQSTRDPRRRSGQNRTVLVDTWCYFVSMEQYWLVPSGIGSVYGSTGWYSMVLGQYGDVLFGSWRCWVNSGQNWLVFCGAGSVFDNTGSYWVSAVQHQIILGGTGSAWGIANWSADILSGWTFCQEDVLSGPP